MLETTYNVRYWHIMKYVGMFGYGFIGEQVEDILGFNV